MKTPVMTTRRRLSLLLPPPLRRSVTFSILPQVHADKQSDSDDSSDEEEEEKPAAATNGKLQPLFPPHCQLMSRQEKGRRVCRGPRQEDPNRWRERARAQQQHLCWSAIMERRQRLALIRVPGVWRGHFCSSHVRPRHTTIQGFRLR